MAKSAIYLGKIEKYKEQSVVGMKLKMAMYNAVRYCYSEGVPFPYQGMLEEYCIPGRERYIEDRKYYIIQGEEIIETERTIGKTEWFLGKLAESIGGKLVFGKNREPMVIVDGMVLKASRIREDTYYKEEYQEDFSVPFELYPRVLNIVSGVALIETAEGVLEQKEISG